MHRSPPLGPGSTPGLKPRSRPRPEPRRRRLTAVVALLATILASLAVVLAAPTPANAVPVDAVFQGTVSNSANGTSAPVTLRVSSSGANRSTVGVTAEVGNNSDPTRQLTVKCGLFQSFAVPAFTQALSGGGGVPSAAPPTTPTITASGTMTWANLPIFGNLNVDITINAMLTRDRGALVGGTVTLNLPTTCAFGQVVTLNITGMSDDPYAIRTRHDGTTRNGTDLTHMIDRESNSTPTPWERSPCMFLDAVVTNPSATPATGLATWEVISSTSPGARIKSGWEHGDPSGTNARTTQLCITDKTTADSLIVVTFRPNGTFTEGRGVIWVGDNVPYVGRGQGDVHNMTFDEVRYDFQGVGEYVDAVALSPAANGGKDFAVQSRLEAVPSAPVTVTTAVAALVNGDRVTISLDASGRVGLRVNGRAVRRFPASLPNGGTLTNPTADHWRINWADNGTAPGATTDTTLQVSLARWTPKDHLNIDEQQLGYGLSQGGGVAGLFGSPDRDGTNDLTPSWGGNPASPDIDPAQPAYEQPLYADFGRSWLVNKPGSGTPQDSMFDYTDPNHPDPDSYYDEKYPAGPADVVDDGARAACLKAGVTAHPQLDFCTYDVSVTGARDITSYYVDGWQPV